VTPSPPRIRLRAGAPEHHHRRRDARDALRKQGVFFVRPSDATPADRDAGHATARSPQLWTTDGSAAPRARPARGTRRRPGSVGTTMLRERRTPPVATAQSGARRRRRPSGRGRSGARSLRRGSSRDRRGRGWGGRPPVPAAAPSSQARTARTGLVTSPATARSGDNRPGASSRPYGGDASAFDLGDNEFPLAGKPAIPREANSQAPFGPPLRCGRASSRPAPAAAAPPSRSDAAGADGPPGR
jgi:hypothetical protein